MNLKYTVIIILFTACFVSAGEPGAIQHLQSNLPPSINLGNAEIIPHYSGFVPRTKTASARERKDPKPFLKSLLIPGWGQFSQERKNTALQFIGTEALLWGGMFALQNYGGLLKDDYKSYAQSYAGITSEGKNHAFFVNIGNYDSVDDYNLRQQIERDYESLYLGNEYYWQWNSLQQRNTYEDMRIKSDLYLNSVVYFTGAIVINHIWSAVDAARHAKTLDSVEVGVGMSPNGNSMLTIIKGF